MMMIYGMFVFELRTLPHQQLQHNKTWRHVKNERINRSASWQYIGAGDDQITLSGVLYPEITGGEVSLSLLTTQAYTGRPWPLIDGVGQIPPDRQPLFPVTQVLRLGRPVVGLRPFCRTVWFWFPGVRCRWQLQ